MADRKITDLTALAAGSQATGDLLTIVDVSESAAADKNKKITVESLFKGIPGDVGINRSSPSASLDVESASDQTVLRLRNNAGNNTRLLFANAAAGLGEIFYQGDFRFVDDENADAERLRIDSSGNVGIGLTSPGAPLVVRGGSASNPTIRIEGGSTGNDNARIESKYNLVLACNGDGDQTDRKIQFRNDVTDLVTIDSSGNVGIGETAPDVKLYINGGSDNTIVKIESSDAGARIRLTDIHASSSIEQNSNELILSSDTNSADGSSTITFKVDNSEKARLDSSGRLMVGTTSPGSSTADDLTIAKTGHVGISIRSGTSSRGNIYFADGTSGNDQFRGYIQYDHSGNYLRFATNAVERMRILSGGGITFNGDTSAANALDDYEEGTFTVTYVPSSGSFTAATYAEQNGSYTKIGNRLFFNLRIRTSGLTKGSASGDLKISGLPYDVINDSTNGRNAIAISIANEWAGDVPSGGHCQVNSDDLFLLYRDASDGAALSVTVDDMGTALNKNQLWITGSYRVS